jgi:uncharacterized protein YbjQ (UPF0145 family)
MGYCRNCNKKMGFFGPATDGYCYLCAHELGVEPRPELHAEDEHRSTVVIRDADLEAIVLTTETAPDFRIARRIEVITAECSFGHGAIKGLFASVGDSQAGRTKAVQKVLRDSRRFALHELKREAYLVGANAVLGVKIDYVDFTVSEAIVMLVASGTAVIAEIDAS